jgi:hypothetical protein
MGGTPIQDPQHFIERLTKCDRKRRLNIVCESISRTECGSCCNRALSERLAARIAKRGRMTSQRCETETERFGWECTHHLIDKKCGVESRLIEL